MNNLDNLINLENKEGKVVVSSREVARNFEKRHADIIRAAEDMLETAKNGDNAKLRTLFVESEYEPDNSNGVKYKEYLLTKDAFTLLAMGFTGKKALEWKLKYIEAFNKMQKALSEVYEISETAIVHNITSKLFKEIDNRFEKYEENYRPTHKNKMDLDKYIKSRLGVDREDGEVSAVKERVLLMLGADSWQDVPYKELIDSMDIIEDSVKAIASFRTKKQLNMWD